MEKFIQQHFEGERALYAKKDLYIKDSFFDNGESHLKESRDLVIENCIFGWKYPLWNCERVSVKDSTLLTTARSGIWYTHNINMEGCTVDAPKTFRRSSGITLHDCTMPSAIESLWSCSDITIDKLSAAGDYFCLSCENVKVNDLRLSGNYAFDGCKNITLENSRLISKDAFWNCENVTVKNSTIIGEYLGWNSKNLTFENCMIESNQGLCYIENLTLINCKLIHTDLAFEYCKNLDASVMGKIDSVKNITSGKLSADEIGEIILDEKFTNPEDVKITVKSK